MDQSPGEWQYKVMSGSFTSRESIDVLIDEQSQWGWQLVEVMNPYQVRLGRSNQQALKDVGREGNPYATTRSWRYALPVWLVVLGAVAMLFTTSAFALLMLRSNPPAPVLLSPTQELPRKVEITPKGVILEHYQYK